MSADDRPGTPDGRDGIHTIRASGIHRGWNGIHYKTGLSAKNVPARELSMNVARIPPRGVAFAHIHVDFEVMLAGHDRATSSRAPCAMTSGPISGNRS